MGDGSSIRWTQDALTELNTLALNWQLTDDQMLMLRQHAERRAYKQVAPSDVRSAWDLHRPQLFPRAVPRPGEGEQGNRQQKPWQHLMREGRNHVGFPQHIRLTPEEEAALDEAVDEAVDEAEAARVAEAVAKEASHMQQQPRRPPQRMKPLDRVLCITAALFGIGAFIFALRGVGDPRNSYPGWVLPFGILCLIAGLTAASFVTWRGRWR